MILNPYRFATSNPFLTTWNSGADKTILLPLFNGETYNFTVLWGDGTSSTITAWNQAETTHVYPLSNTQYQVSISGACPRWYFNNSSTYRAKLTSIVAWGTQVWTSLNGAFYGCTGLTSIAAGGNFSTVANCDFAWRGCTSLTSFPALSFPAATSCGSTWYNCPFTSFPALSFPLVTDLTEAWRLCQSLTSFPSISCPLVTNLTLAWSSCISLTTFLTTAFPSGFNFLSAWVNTNIGSFPTITFASGTGLQFSNCNFNATTLNTIFTNLTSGAHTITITGNPGAGTCDTTIATNKGWTVVG